MDSNRNTALLRTAAAFCHPVTIAAVAIMLLNDHLFKAWWPGSWATGKLSDAAWVTFAPLFVALAAALLLPRRLKRRDSIVLWLSLSVTAVSYFLFNSWEPFHHLVNAFFSAAFGWGPHERDATDSVTLVALAVTWWLWWRPICPSALRTKTLVVGSVAALATMATSVAPGDVGISYLEQDGQRLVAASQAQVHNTVFAAFTSSDGGLTWAPMKEAEFPQPTGDPGPETRVVGSSSVQYQFVPGVSVERSDDGGVTWREEYDLRKVSHQARRLYYEEHVPDRLPGKYIVTRPGPLWALVDRSSGNLVLAMGQDGVLVRSASGQWTWSAVGPYHLETMGPLSLLSLLFSELLLAVILVVLAFATVLRGLRGGSSGSLIVLTLTWLWWLFVTFSSGGRGPTSVAFPALGSMEWVYVLMALPVLFGAFVAIALTPVPQHVDSLVKSVVLVVLVLLFPTGLTLLFLSGTGFAAYVVPGFFVLYFSLVPGLAWAIYLGEPRLLWRIIAAMVVEFILYLVPFVLWSQGLIPEYRGATLLAIILGVTSVGAAVSYLTWYRRQTRHGEAVERGRDGP